MSETKLTANEIAVLRWIDRDGIEPPPSLPVGELSRVYDWLRDAGFFNPACGPVLTESGRKALMQEETI